MHWCWAWYSKNGKLHTNRGRWKYLNTFRPRLWILIRARRKRLGRPRSSELSTCAGVRKSRRDARPSNADNRKLSGNARRRSRSEEHTSELQSRGQLVCRLLLEKKNKRKRNNT